MSLPLDLPLKLGSQSPEIDGWRWHEGSEDGSFERKAPASQGRQLTDRNAVTGHDERLAGVERPHDRAALVAQLPLSDLPWHASSVARVLRAIYRAERAVPRRIGRARNGGYLSGRCRLQGQMAIEPARIITNIPFRLDRLPWAKWHWAVVVGLGITWVLDGLEVTIVGTIGSTLASSSGLDFTAEEAGLAASAYLIGACTGAVVFGLLTDTFGRKRLFSITLSWYLAGTLLSALSWNFWSFAVFRMLAGAGIGGEYSAINSAIDELIPAHHRGNADVAINGSWWLGTLLASLVSIPLLDGRWIPTAIGWRLAFGLGGVLAFGVLFVRRGLPESPRWLLTHGRATEAEQIVADIERTIEKEAHAQLPPTVAREVSFESLRGRSIFVDTASTMSRIYPKRTVLVMVLMVTQAFLYNAVFFTQGLTLTTFFNVSPSAVGLYTIPFAIGNFLGALLLGRLFDTVGRKAMIAGCYLVSGLSMAATTALFLWGKLDAATLTAAWSAMFFFASAGASAAYLTVSEIFPLEIRASAIALVYAIGTLVGGAIAPPVYGWLIGTKDPRHIAVGWLLGATLMVIGGITELILGVDAERKSLEDVAPPLTAR
jgi:MFS family permease